MSDNYILTDVIHFRIMYKSLNPSDKNPAGGWLWQYFTSAFVLHSIYLGLRDADLETVFRTDEGFTASWVKWASTEPNDPSISDVQDCVMRLPDGQ